MKKVFFGTVFAVLLFYSCTNSSAGKNAENPSKQPAGNASHNSGSSENVISFKVNGQPVTTSGWNISRSVMMGMMVLNVTSDMHREPRTINVNVNGDKAGTYSFMKEGGFNKAGQAYGSYFPDYKQEMINPFSFQEGEFVITSMDTTAGLLNAFFSGTAVNSRGEKINITEGKVTGGKLSKVMNRY